LGLRRVKPGVVIVNSVKNFVADDMITYAAALAYQVFFSLFPFVIFLLALLSFLRIPGFFDTLLNQAATVLPGQSMSLLERVVGEIQGRAAGGLLSFGIVFAVFIASAAVRAAMHAFNIAYGVEQERAIWWQYPFSILYTLLFAVLVIAAVALMVLGPRVAEWFAEFIGFGELFVALWTYLRWPVAILLLVVAVALINYLFPNVDQRFRFITPGAVLSVVVWISASLGFSFYVSTLGEGSYTATYGSIGAVIVLLLYLYISAAVLLLGAEVNAEIHRQATAGNTGAPEDTDAG
jgi:membrane protein